MSADLHQAHLSNRKNQEITATNLLVALNTLAGQDVAVRFFGERLPLNVAKVLGFHDQYGVDVAASLALAQALVEKGLKSTSIDLGQAVKAGKQADAFNNGAEVPATDVVLYGFGRIGRILSVIVCMVGSTVQYKLTKQTKASSSMVVLSKLSMRLTQAKLITPPMVSTMR